MATILGDVQYTQVMGHLTTPVLYVKLPKGIVDDPVSPLYPQVY